jgi:hypothetical protein
MGKRWLVLGVFCAGACDQELELPQAPPKQTAASVPNRPSDGITGAAGVAPESEPPERLPLPTEPQFTSFGGEGGQGVAGANDAADPLPTRGGTGGAGGAKSNGGASGFGGTQASGGTGGTKSNGGAGGTLPITPGGGEGGDAGSPTAGLPQLYFSEYVEGSGSFKALEIYAVAATSLEGCELETFSNGKAEPSRLALHGALSAGQTHVLCSSTLAMAQPSACSRSTSLTFNGDDALALSCAGVTLDVFGEIGVDPGESWADGATVDHTLRRRCSVTQGRAASELFDVDAEWITFGTDTFTDLGRRECAPPL